VDTAYSDFLFLTGTYSDFLINGFVVINIMLKNKDAIAREDSGASFDECLAEQNKCQSIQDCGQIDPFLGPDALFVSCFLSCTTRNTWLRSTLSQLLFLLLWGLKLENPKVSESYFPGVDSLFVETFAKLRSRISDD
jgi:hypothetical protein